MSSFIVSSSTINQIVHLLTPNEQRSMMPDEYYNQLGNELWDLNYAATTERYKHRNDNSGRNVDYLWRPQCYTKLQMIKSAQCWLYQCSEGDQFEKSALYQKVKTAVYNAMFDLVSELPQYDKLPWGDNLHHFEKPIILN